MVGKTSHSAENLNYEPSDAMKICRCSVATQETMPFAHELVTQKISNSTTTKIVSN